MNAFDLTVVITNWNYGKFLRKAIASVEAQATPPTCWFIVDDASTDEESLAIYAELSEEKVFKHAAHWGAVAAYNTGLHLCRTEWILYLDADDELAPSYIYDCMEAAIRCQVPWVYTGVHYVDESSAVVGEELHQVFNREDLLTRHNFIHSAALVKTELLRRAGGWHSHQMEDWNLWQRVARLGAMAAWVNKPLLLYRKHGESRMLTGRGDL